MITENNCMKCGKNAVWIVFGINLALFIIKLIFAFISRSYSLFADSFESFANLIITVIVLVSLGIAERKQDEKHPYGYGKMEYLASGAINLLLLLAAVFFIITSFTAMVSPGTEAPPEMSAIIAAVISIIANQIAFLYGRCAGTRLQSPAILANASVNQVDVATSVAVIIAVVGANLGISFLDHLVAIIIAVLIIKTTFDGISKSVKGLMDYSPKIETRKIRNAALKVRGVLGVGDLKTRRVGRRTWVDMEILISNRKMVKDGLEIIDSLKHTVHKKIQNIAEISVRLTPVKSEG